MQDVMRGCGALQEHRVLPERMVQPLQYAVQQNQEEQEGRGDLSTDCNSAISKIVLSLLQTLYIRIVIFGWVHV